MNAKHQMLHSKYRLYLFWVNVFLFFPMFAEERITLFSSVITVNSDASLNVHETIAVQSEGLNIRHGIVREFPTKYKNVLGINYVIPFNVTNVTLNGNPVGYNIEDASNGKKIYVGDKNVHLSPGRYVFGLTYTTERQLGFFENHDELYWNATGNGSPLPIDQVQATVLLPDGAAITSAEGYTGYQGYKGFDCSKTINSNRVFFTTTRRLERHEGFTLVATWPKGIIHKPSLLADTIWVARNNVLSVAMFLICLVTLLLLLSCFVRAWRVNKQGIVIPRFYPPNGLTPSAVGFMQNLGFKDSLIAAEVVYLAVRGFITIDYHEKMYVLTQTDKVAGEDKEISDYDRTLMRMLFPTANTLVVEKSNHKILRKVTEKIADHCALMVGRHIKDDLHDCIVYMSVFAVFVFIVSLIFSKFTGSSLTAFPFIFLAVIFGMLWLASRFCKRYTAEGRKIQDEIDGFKLYLETTELERMKIVGTPPVQTPELYESYLPYAMLLGVENQWQNKFTPMFEKLEKEGRPYVPIWNAGRPFRIYSFTNDFQRSSGVQSVISASSYRPGSSSGSGGRGSSGGGGGGGGVGGW